MLGIHELWLFIVSGLLLNVTPGPDTAYIVGRSLQLGWRGGAVAVLGIEAGCLLHVFAAAIGLSALLTASSVAFTLVKWAGAAYLCFVGVKMLLARVPTPVAAVASGTGAISLRQVFVQGALTNALNPKVALFFLAFLPQFVDTDSPHKAAAFALLGLIFIFNGTLWCLGVAAFAAGAAGRIRKSNRAFAWINRTLGGMFVYLGVRVAMTQSRGGLRRLWTTSQVLLSIKTSAVRSNLMGRFGRYRRCGRSHVTVCRSIHEGCARREWPRGGNLSEFPGNRR